MTWPSIELVWRKVRDSNGGFAEWVRDLSDRSGVYLIRSDPSHFTDEMLYIGESHTHNGPGQRRSYRGLYRTLTRHFHGHRWEEGTTYDPDDVLVAVVITAPEDAVRYQDMLISRYKPRDNELVKQLRFKAWGITEADQADAETDVPSEPWNGAADEEEREARARDVALGWEFEEEEDDGEDSDVPW